MRTRTMTLGAAAFSLVVTLAVPAAADTPWGSTGAGYRSGVVCALPDGRRVAMASWTVNGATAFSITDVVARGSSYGPAPRAGRVTDLPSRRLSSARQAALAYLIAHDGTGTSAQVARTSVLVARAFGGGAAQQACLDRQGSSTAATAMARAAQSFAGPYTVQVALTRAKPGAAVPVTATVLSAAGVPTPGIAVTFAAGPARATGTTAGDGRAVARLTAPAADTPLTATATEPTSLRLIASRPASVTLGATRTAVGRARIVPASHPSPQLAIGGGVAAGGLVLAGGSLTPTATVTGSFGYSGTGTIGVLGPVAAPGGGTCSDASFATAPTVWTRPFTFSGDGPRAAGSTGALQPGCYAFAGSLTTTDATPAVSAQAAAAPASAVAVSSVQLTQTTGSGLARTGALAATITASGAAGASVSSTVTIYGPLPAGAGGRCGPAWTAAKVLARSAAVPLVAQGPDRLTATVHTAIVRSPGCYALVARSTVTQDGRSAVVSAVPGAAGTTVMVIAPTVDVTNNAYDGRQGVPMTGMVRIAGTYGLAGEVAIGLVSAPAPPTGCHGLTLTATSVIGSTVVSTDGDGDYRFRSPVPSRNRCYGVVATLAMATDAAVRVAAVPGSSAVFLAGAVVRAPAPIEVESASAAPATRELAVFGVAGGAVLLLALVMMIAAAVAGEHKPDPRAGELLGDLTRV